MTLFVAELVGTALLVLLGNGVVANALLRGTKGEGSGWIVITWGWAMAVFVGVFATARFSGAHLNPAVTVGLAASGQLEAGQVPIYVVAQMLGGMIGAALVWLQYHPHWAPTEDLDLAPRLMHALLPIPGGKRDSDWSYSWIPVVGPVLGAVLAALLYLALASPQVNLPGG